MQDSLANKIADSLPRLTGPAPMVRLVKTSNDVFHISGSGGSFFLKTYTKSWYGADAAATGFCANHEAVAWGILASHHLPAPEVASVSTSIDNPLGRPYILTRQLRGQPLTDWLARADAAARAKALALVGGYLRQMHAITFQFAGYLTTPDGPNAAPDPQAWQHRCWTAQQRQREALAEIAQVSGQGDPRVVTTATAAAANITRQLADAYQPPRFTHGDCHAHQFFLDNASGQLAVTGVVDMEVSSAGDGGEDLLKICLELAQRQGNANPWWEALFAGYGAAPDFDDFRLRLLGVAPAEYGSGGRWVRGAPRRALLNHILQAANWATLFAPVTG